MLKVFFSLSFFNFLAAGIGFVLTILYGKYLSVSDYGNLYFFISIIYVISFIVDGGFSTSLVIKISKIKDISIQEIYLNFLGFYIKYFKIILPIILTALFFVIKSIEMLSVFYLLFLLLAGGIGGVQKIILSIFQGRQNWVKFNIVNVFLNSFRLVLILLFIIFFDDLYFDAVLYILLISVIVQFILSFFFLSNENKKLLTLKTNIRRFDIRTNTEFKNHFLTFILITIVTVTASRVDIIISKYILDSESLGVYSMASSMALVFPLITNSFIQTLLSFSGEPKRKGENRRNSIVFIIVVLILVINWFFSPLLFASLFGDKFENSIWVYKVLSSIYILSFMFTPIEVYFMAEKPKLILILKIVQLLILVIFPFVFFSKSLEGVLFSVGLSRLVAWSILFCYNYDTRN